MDGLFDDLILELARHLLTPGDVACWALAWARMFRLGATARGRQAGIPHTRPQLIVALYTHGTTKQREACVGSTYTPLGGYLPGDAAAQWMGFLASPRGLPSIQRDMELERCQERFSKLCVDHGLPVPMPGALAMRIYRQFGPAALAILLRRCGIILGVLNCLCANGLALLSALVAQPADFGARQLCAALRRGIVTLRQKHAQLVKNPHLSWPLAPLHEPEWEALGNVARQQGNTRLVALIQGLAARDTTGPGLLTFIDSERWYATVGMGMDIETLAAQMAAALAAT
jgi:hypothetical protein